MKDSEIINFFKSFFIHRKDVYALQMPSGEYILKKEKITNQVLHDHLKGKITIAIYPIDPETNSVIWGVFDFDHNPLEQAKKLYNYLNNTQFKNSFLVEDTGGRGIHIWVFFKPTSAYVARTILLEIAEKLKLNAEVFPKQDYISMDQYGNAVKLPLGIHKKTGNRSTIIYPSDFSEITPLEVPQEIIESIENETSSDSQRKEVIVRRGWWTLCPAYETIKKGVPEGKRDVAAFFLARIYRDIGLTREEALLLLKNWNKKNKPPLKEKELRIKIRQAYDKKYSVGFRSILKSDALREYCPPECNICPYKRNKEIMIDFIRKKLLGRL